MRPPKPQDHNFKNIKKFHLLYFRPYLHSYLPVVLSCLFPYLSTENLLIVKQVSKCRESDIDRLRNGQLPRRKTAGRKQLGLR